VKVCPRTPYPCGCALSKATRIASIRLDDASIARRSAEAEHERQVAIADLIGTGSIAVIDPHFAPLPGPYDLFASVREQRLMLGLTGKDGKQCDIALVLAPFRSVIKDYFLICESYYEAIKTASRDRIQTIDMARRGLHNEGSEMLQSLLEQSLTMDLSTARRLFTLICVLHIK
jgi:uncharacterized protein (UPF0262 family)